MRVATAVKFGLLYALISFFVKTARELDWHGGLLPLSFVSGLTDMDAISLSLVREKNFAKDALQATGHAIVLAAISNTLVKAGIAITLG